MGCLFLHQLYIYIYMCVCVCVFVCGNLPGGKALIPISLEALIKPFLVPF